MIIYPIRICWACFLFYMESFLNKTSILLLSLCSAIYLAFSIRVLVKPNSNPHKQLKGSIIIMVLQIGKEFKWPISFLNSINCREHGGWDGESRILHGMVNWVVYETGHNSAHSWVCHSLSWVIRELEKSGHIIQFCSSMWSQDLA